MGGGREAPGTGPSLAAEAVRANAVQTAAIVLSAAYGLETEPPHSLLNDASGAATPEVKQTSPQQKVTFGLQPTQRRWQQSAQALVSSDSPAVEKLLFLNAVPNKPLVAAYSDGSVAAWSSTTGECLLRSHTGHPDREVKKKK